MTHHSLLDYRNPLCVVSETVMPSYDELVHDVTHLGESCDINAIFALSAVIGFPIRTFWPPLSASLQPCPLTQYLVGRGVDRGTHVVDSGIIGPLSDVDLKHFVPLVHRPNPVPSEATSQLVTRSTHHPVNSSHGQLVTGQLVTRSTRHAVDSSQRGGHKQTNKQTSKPYCRSSNYPYP